jgi:hypothetical protein
MRLPSVGLWWHALGFYLRNVLTLLPVSPLLYLPIYTDVLHTHLLKQEIEGGIQMGTAAAAAMRDLPPTFGLKLRNELKGFALSLIPVVFIMRVIEHRLCWGLASNVVVFEGLRGDEADERCRVLARAGYDVGLRGLVGMPTLSACS